MEKRFVLAVLAVLLAASAYSQTTDELIKNDYKLVQNGTPQDVQAAISNGADIEARGNEGLTPLIWAAGSNKNPEVIATLLKAGADIEARDSYYGRTALMFAVIFNDIPEVITTLLAAGADAKVKDSTGKTAFDYAQDNWKLKGTDALKQLEEASK